MCISLKRNVYMNGWNNMQVPRNLKEKGTNCLSRETQLSLVRNTTFKPIYNYLRHVHHNRQTPFMSYDRTFPLPTFSDANEINV